LKLSFQFVDSSRIKRITGLNIKVSKDWNKEITTTNCYIDKNQIRENKECYVNGSAITYILNSLEPGEKYNIEAKSFYESEAFYTESFLKSESFYTSLFMKTINIFVKYIYKTFIKLKN